MAGENTNEQATLRFEVPGRDALVRQSGEKGADIILRVRDEVIKGTIAEFGGHEQTGDSSTVMFESVSKAVECAHALQQAFSVLKAPPGMANLRMAISAPDRETIESSVNGAEVWLTGAARAALGEGLFGGPMAREESGTPSMMAREETPAPSMTAREESPAPSMIPRQESSAPSMTPREQTPQPSRMDAPAIAPQTPRPQPSGDETIVDVPRIVPRGGPSDGPRNDLGGAETIVAPAMDRPSAYQPSSAETIVGPSFGSRPATDFRGSETIVAPSSGLSQQPGAGFRSSETIVAPSYQPGGGAATVVAPPPSTAPTTNHAGAATVVAPSAPPPTVAPTNRTPAPPPAPDVPRIADRKTDDGGHRNAIVAGGIAGGAIAGVGGAVALDHFNGSSAAAAEIPEGPAESLASAHGSDSMAAFRSGGGDLASSDTSGASSQLPVSGGGAEELQGAHGSYAEAAGSGQGVSLEGAHGSYSDGAAGNQLDFDDDDEGALVDLSPVSAVGEGLQHAAQAAGSIDITDLLDIDKLDIDHDDFDVT